MGVLSANLDARHGVNKEVSLRLEGEVRADVSNGECSAHVFERREVVECHTSDRQFLDLWFARGLPRC
jgi:hypothetical protein